MNLQQWAKRLAGLVLVPMALCVSAVLLRPSAWFPQPQSALFTHTVHAYRQWQSSGIFLEAGDRVDVEATGEWQYSPLLGLHDADGGSEYAPDSYPLSNARASGRGYGIAAGGALIGRIGDTGVPFWVGRQTTIYVTEPGLLYFTINDDLLGDNKGKLTLTLLRATPEP